MAKSKAPTKVKTATKKGVAKRKGPIKPKEKLVDNSDGEADGDVKDPNGEAVLER